MENKICSKCGEEKPLDQYRWRRKGIRRRSDCKSCWSKYIGEHYRKNRQYYLDKANSYNASLRGPLRAYITNYLIDHPCIECGESRIPCLVFDHVRGVKEYTVSRMWTHARKWMTTELIQAEIDKCEVRCANCHRIRHAREKCT